MEISRGMYGLQQSDILANKLLGKRLAEQVYHELPHTPGLFRHETGQIWFTLVVEDFGIKYIGEESTNHILGVLKELNEIEEDWNGSLYCGITLNWHYEEQYVDIAMPNYVPNQLLTYGRPSTKLAQHTPFEPRPINYGAKSDTIIHENPGNLLGDSEKIIYNKFWEVSCIMREL